MRVFNRNRLAVALVLTVATAPLLAIELSDILKAGGVVAVVKVFGKQINDAINTVLMNRKLENKQATKVVPIVSIGSGAYVGAAQVIGDKDAVRKVEAVAQIEVNLPGSARGKILIPIDNATNLSKIRRVYKVGISAVIDVKL